MNKNYQICQRCVMDTSDQEIYFDKNGVCNHCQKFDKVIREVWLPNDVGRQKLEKIFDKIKRVGKNKDYDCIIGLSGGIDSSYLALIIKDYGLRPLVMHVDAGWNSELAVSNIEAISKYCDYDLVTHVVDWEEMRDLQISYLKSGIANQDVPQDHVIFSSLYHYAAKNNIKYVLSGSNYSTESIFPSSWHGSAMDKINLIAIHDKFGKSKLKSYRTINFFEYHIFYPLIKKIQVISPLNYIYYNKNEAENVLVKTIGYKPYGRKHGESIFTKVFQNYYLPAKFGYDKRRPHLSSLILTGQITRDDSIKELNKPLYNRDELEADLDYLCKKLRISRSEFERFISSPNRSYNQFKNWDKVYSFYRTLKKYLNKLGYGCNFLASKLAIIKKHQ